MWFTSMMEELPDIGKEGQWGIRLQVRTDAKRGQEGGRITSTSNNHNSFI